MVVCLLMTSCDDFLDLKPRDQKVVSTVEDYRDIMSSYMQLIKVYDFPRQEIIFGIGSFTYPLFDVALNLGVYTGETNLGTNYSSVYDSSTGTFTNTGRNMLTWRMTNTYAWDRYYTFLGPINLIISGISEAEGTNENLRNYVKGEALIWRAFSYFKLLQYFAPYNNNEYGVPIYLTPEQDIGTAMPKRKTQTEVFAQILSDCDEAFKLLDITPTNRWNCAYRSDFLNSMVASVYAWKAMSAAGEDSDWGNAIKYATEAMRGRQLANTPEFMKDMFDSYDVKDINSAEFSFRIISSADNNICNFSDAYYDGYVDGYVNPKYFNKFKPTDIRRKAWFSEDGRYSNKYNLLGQSSYGTGCIIPFRLAEMYLVKAEALVRGGKTGEAVAVMTEFCNARYEETVTLPNNSEELLQVILDERIREFYMENDHRWLDMKRLGVTDERIVNGERFVLKPDDFRYSFPIPARELELNTNMVQTPGWEKIVL